MKQIFKDIKNNSLIKVASLNSVLVFSRLIYGFVASKVVAVYLGPQGLALLGNFRDFTQVIYNFSAKNFESGIIKYVAEEKFSSKTVVATLVKLALVLSLLISPILYLCDDFFSQLVFNREDYFRVFKLLCFLLPLISLNLMLLSIINGKKLHTILVKIQVLGFLLNALLLTVLTIKYGLEGALLASVFTLALQLFVSVLFLKNKIASYFSNIFSKIFNTSLVRGLLSYFLMAVFSISLVFVVSFIIRNTLIDSIDVQHGGYWEAITRISSFYLLFFSSMLTFYLLPKLSESKKVGEYRLVMKEYITLIVPLIIITLCVVYFLRDVIISILLTKEFVFISSILIWQLLGDLIRVIAISFAYQFHAKRKLKAYYISDAIFYLSYLILSLLFIENYGVKGVLFAYLIANALYLIAVTVFLKNELFKLNKDAIIESQ